jgi:hypothetical protein
MPECPMCKPCEWPDLIDGVVDKSTCCGVYTHKHPCQYCNNTKQIDWEMPEIRDPLVSFFVSEDEYEETKKNWIAKYRYENPAAYVKVGGVTYEPLDPDAVRFPEHVVAGWVNKPVK